MTLAPSPSRLQGEVLQDAASRESYSVAECIYRVAPLCAVLPRTTEDVLEVLRFAREEGSPITARGAGSAVAGQSVGTGIILDFSRHMNSILEIHVEERWARVQPGVVLKDLNRRLAPLKLRFVPDPSSSDFCTLGGMIANNAGGPRSVRYGPTRDHVLSLTVALAGGEIFETRTLSSQELRGSHTGTLHRLSRDLEALLAPRREEIRRAAPDVRRISSGYELRRSVGEKGVDLAQILVGSEGTLAIVLEAKLRLLPLPSATATALIHFRDLDAMGEGVLRALRHEPSALEALDRSFLEWVRQADQAEARSLPEDTEAVLIVELEGESEAELQARLRRLEEDLVCKGPAQGILPGLDPKTRDRIWEIRKSASPILTARQKHLRNTRFIEDACVPTPRFPEFLREVRKLLARHGLEAAVFGHAGDAILHVNPLLDPADPALTERMERIISEHAEIVLSLAGALSGEHGDGRLRTPLLASAFGSVTDLYREVKRLFDPLALLNPGIKVHDGRSRPFDHLDLGPRPVHGAIPVW
jgi:FAD/FMN-containing dehydrogenase